MRQRYAPPRRTTRYPHSALSRPASTAAPAVTAVAFDETGKYLAAGDKSGVVSVYASDGDERHSHYGGMSPKSAASASPQPAPRYQLLHTFQVSGGGMTT